MNVTLLGSETDVISAVIAAKWDPADPLTFRSGARIAVDSVFRRPNTNAPASTLEAWTQAGSRIRATGWRQPATTAPRSVLALGLAP